MKTLLKENRTMIYEMLMVVLAIFSVATIWYKSNYNDYVVWGTWLVFLVDFLYRLYTAEKKLLFMRDNPFMLIALIPLDAVFQLARTARILHMMRLKTITQYYTKPLMNKLIRQRFAFVIPLSLAFVFIVTLPLYFLEPQISSYWEAFVGGIASLVFFGYTTVTPVSIWGKGIIIFLTVFGVILHGVIVSFLLSAIFNLEIVKKTKERFIKESVK